jgi:glycosyltransferase involved in cell wall biosynthesis
LKLAEATSALAARKVDFLPSTRRIEQLRTTPLKRSGPYRLLFIGRWHTNKGVDLLLDALQLLCDDDWQRIEAVELCGGGPLQDLVSQRVSCLQAAGRPVALRGYLNKNEAIEAIQLSDFLLIPSRRESVPVIYSDAVKLRCVVLSTPVGDLPTLIQGHGCGEVARDLSASAFYRLISDVLAQQVPANYLTGLDNAAADFSIAAIAQQLHHRFCATVHLPRAND